ncbi:AAA family ATPase [Ceratobasidium sp. AG-Ba]|nr:AAA family ATPase [Ceratobasidium sp. AG-Ba]
MSFSRSCSDIKLEGSSTLVALCTRAEGSEPTTSRLDLDCVIGNINGSFRWGDKSFSHSSTNITLDGVILRANLRKINGEYCRDRIDLNECIANANGQLVYISPVEKQLEDTTNIPLTSGALDSMWSSPFLANTESSALPGNFENTLSQLRISLLAKTQRKAVRVAEGSNLVEPTLALYCPIEGGEYVIDRTIKELGERTNSDVQVIDLAQIAAGEWGVYGKVASGFRLKKNPLGKVKSIEEPGEDDDSEKNLKGLEIFWKKVVDSNPLASESSRRSRIIYIRDFGLLAPRVDTWFPPLYTAVRAHRTNGLGPDSPITHPTAIIFGVCPRVSSILPSLGSSHRRRWYSTPSPKEWDEDATKERAKRLKELKDKCDAGTLLQDLPSFTPRVKVLKPNPVKAEGEKDKSESSEEKVYTEYKLDGYFRSCVVAPPTSNAKLERTTRENRRKELNELMVRMAVGVKGGEIEGGVAPVPVVEEDPEKKEDEAKEVDKDKATDKDKTENKDEEKDDHMMQRWAQRLVGPDSLNAVIDRALEVAELSNEDEEQEHIKISWTQLQDAWLAIKNGDDGLKTWAKSDTPDSEEKKEDEKGPVDEIVEEVKSADLDKYERRLLPCIVDVAKLSTTFENVHLPSQVVDSIRSIVSLPLLYPDAFKSGILKQQAISGALLFGPPGTGKTHVVRALAKESGSRMLAVKPSDVADMWVGETEKLVKALFKLARRLKPCVVFIDEIDSIMGARTSKSSSGGSRWHTSMLTEFMQEMDGLIASSVIVIGATNRPFDIDDAVLRRLPCRLLVDLPGVEARKEILKIMLKDDELASDVNVNELARKTDRFSGSDLKNLCVAAAMDALKETVKLPWVTKNQDSKEKIAAGSSTTPADKIFSKTTAAPEKDIAKSESSDDESSTQPSDPDSESPSTPSSGTTTPEEKPEPPKPRILYARHFTRALMDVAPSSSESQGSLSELRKWNSQFGTGVRDQPRTTIGSLPSSYGANSYTPGSSSVPGLGGASSYGSSLGSSGLGSSSFGSGGLGSSGLGSGRLAAGGLGGSGLSSIGLGSSGLGTSGLSSLGSTGLSSLGGTGGEKPVAPGVGAYTPSSYTPPNIGSTYSGYTPKLPTYGRNIPGYTPSNLGSENGPSAPGS